MHTIEARHWREIRGILLRHSAMLEWVKLFGSRARGDAKVASDVDFAVSGSADAAAKLALAFEDSNLPYTFDMVDYKRQGNEKLKRAIDRDGKLIFSHAGGASLMTRIRIEEKKEDYHHALARLQVALAKEPDADEMYLDATIQRFEFCFELAWKLLKACLDYEGVEASSPRASIREGWKQGMIEDAEAWLDMQEKRNLSAHTYNEATALEVYRRIKETYVKLLLAWDGEVQRRLDDETN